MGVLKTPFQDATETQVPKGSAAGASNLPSSSSAGISNSPFKDALETKVPNSRTGGALPEVLIDNSVKGPATGLANVPTPGEKFKIG